MSIYGNEEIPYTVKRECDKCEYYNFVDAVYYKDKEYWICPKCKTQYEVPVDNDINLS